jgi:hypothetical protein
MGDRLTETCHSAKAHITWDINILYNIVKLT